jgi:hypothetical protein
VTYDGGVMRSAIVLAVLAALGTLAAPVATAGATGVGGKSAIAKPRTTVGFWAGEAVPGTDWSQPSTYWKRRSTRVYTPALWRVLRRNRVPLYFNLRYRRDFGPVPAGEPHRHDGLGLIRTANRLGVPVWGWVLIPYSDGYWASEDAAHEQFRAVRSLVHWMHAKRVRLRGLVLDPEPPLQPGFRSTEAILGGASLAAIFQASLDPTAQCAAWRTYARIPRWAGRHHVGVSVAPMPAALDDIGDGSLALEDATNFVVPAAPWHQLFFQAYRSVFSYYSGHDPGPGIVSSYLRSAGGAFGSAGQVTLGSAGRGPYRRLSALVHDVRLAAALGARTLPIYSLERTLRAYGGPRAVLRLVRAAHNPLGGPASKSAAPSARANSLRAKIRHADRTATLSTRPVTAGRGAPASPNRWPNGCR